MSTRADFVAGIRDAAPAVPSTLSFGTIFGATAVSVGLSPLGATAMSLFVYAGAAQMAAVELIGREAGLVVVLVTVAMLNVRYVIYSASITPYVRDLPMRWKLLVAYPLFDTNYALSVATYEADGSVHRGWYYAGASLALVSAFVLATAVGAVVGAAIPPSLELQFVVPLVFMALVVPLVGDRPEMVAALVAGGVAVLAAPVPFNAGLFLGAFAGVAAGVLASRHLDGGEGNSGAEPASGRDAPE